MATVKKTTKLNNVVENQDNKDKDMTKGKNPVVFDNPDFDGSEELEWQPAPFKAFGKTTRITSAELAAMISTEFKKTFHEVRGCRITPVPNNNFITELFFERNNEPLPDGKIMNLESLIDPIGAGGSNNLYYRQQVVQNRKLGKTYTLNNETKLLLSKFMFGGKYANKPNDKKWTNESVMNEVHISAAGNDIMYRGRNMERIFIRVVLDLRRVLQELYGREIITKTISGPDGDTNYRGVASYEPRFIKMSQTDPSFILNIEQFDRTEVEKIIARENPAQFYQNIGGIQMY
jgi:hypothetical protein